MSESEGLRGVAVGDTILTSRFGQPYREATVSAVGRKWVTAGGTKFDIETGAMQGQYLGDAQTLAQRAESVERGALHETLREHGVETYRARLSADQLRRILAIVQRPDDPA